MDINDLKQENSRKIAEEVIEALKEHEDSETNMSESFVLYIEADGKTVLARGSTSPAMLINIMTLSFKTLQEEAPETVWLAEIALKEALSKKNSAD